MNENNEKVISNVNSKSKEERNVPDLRFPKVIDYVPFSSICEIRKKDKSTISGPLIELDCIAQNTGEVIKTYNIQESLSQKNTFKSGDVLFGKLRPYLNKHAIVDYDGFCSSEIWPLVPNTVSSNYLYCIVQSKMFLSSANVSSGTKMPRADWEYLKTVNIPIYRDVDMEKFANIIVKMDDRISTQKKIISNIESHMIYIKNKIYNSHKGKKTLLSEILFERKMYSKKNSKYVHVTLSKEGIMPKTDRYDRDFLVMDENKEYKITMFNDLCYNPANLKFGVICQNKYGDAIFSPIYVTFDISKKYDPDYVCMLLTNGSFIKYIRKFEQGTVYERMAVNSDDFLKAYIYLPEINIQKNIMKCINKIEEKFSNEKRILELYQKQKDYLLNKLFI